MKNQKGFAPILLIAVVVIVAALVGVGYVVTNRGKASVMPKVQLPGISTLNSDCKLKDPELCRYVNQTYKITVQFEKGFSGTTVMTTKDGKKTESVWEMQGDKSHFQSLTDGKEEANLIVIGNTTYTKDMADGKWFKYEAKTTGGTSSQPGLFDFDRMKNTVQETAKELEDKITYKALGKAACGSLTCFKYQIVDPQLTSAKEYLYFDDREYLMRMMQVEDSFGSTVTTFNYGSVSINAPSPVKTDDRFNLYDPSIIEKTQGSVSSINMEELQRELQEMMKNNSQVPSGENTPPSGE